MPGAPQDLGLVVRRNGNRISILPSLHLDGMQVWKKSPSPLAVTLLIPSLRTKNIRATTKPSNIFCDKMKIGGKEMKLCPQNWISYNVGIKKEKDLTKLGFGQFVTVKYAMMDP